MKFWVLAHKTESRAMSARSVIADSPEAAIFCEFGAEVRPASPFEFDFCTQESNENGYCYWLEVVAREPS